MARQPQEPRTSKTIVNREKKGKISPTYSTIVDYYFPWPHGIDTETIAAVSN